MVIHQQDMYDEFIEFNKEAEEAYGIENIRIDETDDEIVINIINRVDE